jgi:hypothetical protein
MKSLKKWTLSDWAIIITTATWFVGVIYLAVKYGN